MKNKNLVILIAIFSVIVICVLCFCCILIFMFNDTPLKDSIITSNLEYTYRDLSDENSKKIVENSNKVKSFRVNETTEDEVLDALEGKPKTAMTFDELRSNTIKGKSFQYDRMLHFYGGLYTEFSGVAETGNYEYSTETTETHSISLFFKDDRLSFVHYCPKERINDLLEPDYENSINCDFDRDYIYPGFTNDSDAYEN